ncbi:MAG TPA: hypothetical protein VN809_15025 [Telmatospirillum sp.]|nr:hypothetical protein [Telmatospirillum sp.]
MIFAFQQHSPASEKTSAKTPTGFSGDVKNPKNRLFAVGLVIAAVVGQIATMTVAVAYQQSSGAAGHMVVRALPLSLHEVW